MKDGNFKRFRHSLSTHGKQRFGMTKEQAIVAIGYPLTSENASLDEPIWRMWRSSHGEYDLHFEPNGRLGSITGEDEVTNLIVYQRSYQANAKVINTEDQLSQETISIKQ